MELQNRKLHSIANTEIFKRLVQAVESYDYSDPLIDTIFPQNNKDSYVIQVLRNNLAWTYWKWTYNQELRYRPDTQNLVSLADELADYLKDVFPETRWFKGHYICLLPNGQQDLHIDAPWWQKHAHRIIVPIATNPDAFTQVDGESIHMEPGQLYELNVMTMHGSTNRGRSIRTHLFLDYIPLYKWSMVEDFYNNKVRSQNTKSILAESVDL